MPCLFDHLDSVLELLSQSPFGLFTDVDGTISEIAPSPGEARVSESCRESLGILARHLAVVGAVSGRPAAEAKAMVGVEGMVYVGNHGFERWVDGSVEPAPGVEDYPARIEATLDEVRELLSIEGVIFENKGPTGSIHYRLCSDHEAALRAIMSAVDEPARASDLKVSLGRMVVEFRPPLEVNKGTAVLSLIEEWHLNGAVYLGDDTTDIDVFEAFRRGSPSFSGVGIAVVGPGTQLQVADRANFTLNGVADVERFLTRFAAEAAGRPGS